MNLIGKTTINPVLFYTGKISGYITWGVLFYQLINTSLNSFSSLIFNKQMALFILLVGLLLSILSMFNLGRSTRLGLPEEGTQLKKRGLYKYSRNPMYVGFDLLTIAAMLFTLNVWIIIMGTYSLTIYHFIILGEEKFLVNRFGNEYLTYKKNTGRYISFH
jgi:protein-S-isoprenylcysteine O-methyltransferase Ste14